MNDNKTLSERSLTSSTDERNAAIARFGHGYDAFLRRYPTIKNRTDNITSIHDAVFRNGPSLAEIDRTFRDGASEWWTRFMLVEMLSFIGAMNAVTAYQVRGIAARIRQEYYYLTPDELTYFFYSFPFGSYGKCYVSRTVNPQDILIALEKYTHNVFEQRVERYTQQLEMENLTRLNDPDNISWEEYCRRTGRNPKDNPLHRAFINPSHK